MPRLSLCVVARDEEELLPGLLASVRGAVDELVLVDTGSADGTRALAREAGAVVVEQPWRDDFSAPRNLALAHATGDFVLVLDADERLVPGAGAAIRRALRDAAFDVGFVRLHNADRLDAAPEDVVAGRARLGQPGLLPRLLRRAGGLRYEGVVHESVAAWFVARGSRGAPVDADVVHLGAIPAVRDARGKRARNVGLLRARAAREPDDVTALGYLAMELFEAGALAEAAEVAERGWAILDAQPPHRPVRRLAVARALVALKQGAPERAAECAERVERRDGPDPDLGFLRGCAAELLALRRPAGAERARHLEAAVAAHLAAMEAVRAGGHEQILAATPAMVLTRLGVALLLLGRAREAIAAFEGARAAGASGPARVGEAEAHLAAGDPGRALALVEPALDERPDGWIVAACAARALGADADARALLAQALRRAAAGLALPHLAERARALEAALQRAA